MSDVNVVASARATTVPSKKPPPHKVYSLAPLPCFVILVHGVNDVGEAYTHQERGLCEGFNERLNRVKWDLQPGTYKMPAPDDKLEPNPDAIYYRRQPPSADTHSPVIPFYWGFREDDGMDKKGKRYICKNEWHGQWLDRDGNRLDTNGAKNGGAFANATTNLADMWAAGWNSFKGTLNKINADPIHPLLNAPHRRYMVLAALRLVALLRIIRKRYPKAAINLVAHSQGCNVSLLANAFLLEAGENPADGLVMNNPPYALEEPWEEALHKGQQQQTSHARIETLKNLLPKFLEKRVTSPSLDELKEPKRHKGMVGKDWGPKSGKKQNPYTKAPEAFPERDNRGKVYLYFSPEDRTVSMVGVYGIGWQGVPDQMVVDLGGQKESVSVLDGLGSGFRQRVFTEVLRNEVRVKVGLPPHPFLLRAKHSFFSSDKGDGVKRDLLHRTPDDDTWRRITGEALSPPVWADLHAGQSARGQQGVSPLDAAVAITNGGVGSVEEVVDDPRPPAERKPLTVQKRLGLALVKDTVFDTKEIERVKDLVLQAWKRKAPPLNEEEGKARKVWNVLDNAGSGKLWVHRTETPDEARLRWQHQQTEDSYHSAIVGNPTHSRYVTTYDLAIGEPIPAADQDVKFRIYLGEVADWRRTKPSASMESASVGVVDFFNKEESKNKALIEATGLYYEKGIIPAQVRNAAIPKLVVQDTVGQRAQRAAQEANRRAEEENRQLAQVNRKLYQS